MLQIRSALLEESSHISLEKEPVSNPTQGTKRCRITELIDHQGSFTDTLEFMHMNKGVKRSSYHLINKKAWAFVLGDARCQTLLDAKMHRFPRDGFTKTN